MIKMGYWQRKDGAVGGERRGLELPKALEEAVEHLEIYHYHHSCYLSFLRDDSSH